MWPNHSMPDPPLPPSRSLFLLNLPHLSCHNTGPSSQSCSLNLPRLSCHTTQVLPLKKKSLAQPSSPVLSHTTGSPQQQAKTLQRSWLPAPPVLRAPATQSQSSLPRRLQSTTMRVRAQLVIGLRIGRAFKGVNPRSLPDVCQTFALWTKPSISCEPGKPGTS